jgi:DNA-binding NarL/FixJ family response regulator
MNQPNARLRHVVIAAADRLALPITMVQAEALADEIDKNFVPPATAPVLTAGQMGVLLGIARGEKVVETALRLYLLPHTVKSQRRHLYRRLGVGSATAAFARARACGLLPDGGAW